MFSLHQLRKPQYTITITYLVVASLWILFSDGALHFLSIDYDLIPGISIVKGLAFVAVTSLILYIYLRREFEHRFRLESELRQQIRQVEQSQVALKHSEARFRKAIEEAPHPIILMAEDGEILTISRAWLEITGYTADQIKTLDTWTELAYGERKTPILNHIDTLFDLKTRVDEGEFTINCADGTQRIWLFSSTPLGRLPDDRCLVMSIATDVTERVQVEQQLRIKDSAIASSITPFALANLEGRLTYVNNAFLKLWRLTDASEALGRSVLEFWTGPEAAQAVVQTITEQDNYVGELVAQLADGTVAHIELTATMVRDELEHPICMMGSFNDITRQKQAEAYMLENERLRARFQKEQERNALVQRIISALSHDLRTPLTVISTSKDMLLDYYDHLDEERRKSKLKTIGRQVQFALELLDDTVNMARGNLTDVPFRPAPINIAALCRVSVDEIQAVNAKQHRVRFTNMNGRETAVVDEVLVSRILMNLLSNAVKYSPDSGEIRLELDHDNRWLVLRVIDQGIGISVTDLPHIFDPFYRAADVRSISGTGLGLSIVKDCVERHQGRIRVESVPGQGSTFIVELPVM